MQKNKFNNVELLAIQPLTLGDEKKLIDYTYESAQGKPFSICAVTNPLFINTLWSHLYFQYGKNKYGYLPYWSGQKQYLNKSLLDYDQNHVGLRYLILEPKIGIPEQAFKATIDSEDKVSVIDEERKIGHLTVQKRRLANNPQELKDSQNLSKNELSVIETVVRIDPRYSCYINYQ